MKASEIFVDAFGNEWSIFSPGEEIRFTYKCWESEESSDADLWHHTGQIARIIRRLSRDEVDEDEIGPMYEIQFSDGFSGDVGADEVESCN